jgi:shikimate kinase/3-dehydroquinate synthase
VIVLVGFMGAGKSTVGPLVAGRLGLPFVDVDHEIEVRSGVTIAELFSTRGEATFRALERAVTAEVLAGSEAVVALGGGALEDPTTRAAVEGHTVVMLDVAHERALARAGGDGSRPLLRGDTGALYERRRATYERAAHVRVDTDAARPEDVAAAIVASLASAPRRIAVAVPGAYHDVVVGPGVAARLDTLLPVPDDAEVAFVVSHGALRSSAGRGLAALERRGLEVCWFEVPVGEASKSLDTAARLYRAMADAGVHRHDLVVGWGGGVVCDLAGFVAATYHRGVAAAFVPTTLLAQVDAAIGGKNGVNLPHGKNLVGTIRQPIAVVCDVELLATLPAAEVVSGMAEVVKYGFIADPSLLDLVERRAARVDAFDADLMAELVARSAAIKADVVARDEREHGARAHLNYGHTFAHALEHVFAGRLRHGEAVALGMMAAAYLGHELGSLSAADVALHRRVLSAVGLPTTIACELEALEGAWRHDKKYRRGVRFVLLSGIGRPQAGIAPPRAALARALERLAR